MDRRLAANPDDAEALIHRGWLSLTERRLPEAIADLDRAPPNATRRPRCRRGYWARLIRTPATWRVPCACSSRVLERAPEDQDDPARARALRPRPRPDSAGRRRFRPGPRRRSDARSCPLPPRAGDEPAGPVPRGPDRSRRPHHRKPEGLRACTSSGVQPTRPSADAEPARLDRERAHSLLLPKSPDLLNSRAWSTGDRPLRRSATPSEPY